MNQQNGRLKKAMIVLLILGTLLFNVISISYAKNMFNERILFILSLLVTLWMLIGIILLYSNEEKTLKKFLIQLSEINRGDLTLTFTESFKDTNLSSIGQEIDKLTVSINQMLGQLKVIGEQNEYECSRLSQYIEDGYRASEQINVAMGEIASGTEEQTNSIEEISHSTEDIQDGAK